MVLGQYKRVEGEGETGKGSCLHYTVLLASLPFLGILMYVQHHKLQLSEVQSFYVSQLAEPIWRTSSNAQWMLLEVLLLLCHLHVLGKEFGNATRLHRHVSLLACMHQSGLDTLVQRVSTRSAVNHALIAIDVLSDQ